MGYGERVLMLSAAALLSEEVSGLGLDVHATRLYSLQTTLAGRYEPVVSSNLEPRAAASK